MNEWLNSNSILKGNVKISGERDKALIKTCKKGRILFSNIKTCKKGRRLFSNIIYKG
jgi:hypothetical protein